MDRQRKMCTTDMVARVWADAEVQRLGGEPLDAETFASLRQEAEHFLSRSSPGEDLKHQKPTPTPILVTENRQIMRHYALTWRQGLREAQIARRCRDRRRLRRAARQNLSIARHWREHDRIVVELAAAYPVGQA
jgi:hypothetical protein